MFIFFVSNYSFSFSPSFSSLLFSYFSFALTGNHRVLEVDASQPTAVVKRVFGSTSGISGAAADGTTIDKMLLNRYREMFIDILIFSFLLPFQVFIKSVNLHRALFVTRSTNTTASYLVYLFISHQTGRHHGRCG